MQLNAGARRPFLLERMEAFRIARDARVIRTFQNVRLFARMSVLENLLVAQHAALGQVSALSTLFAFPSYGKAARKATERARYWLDKTGLAPAANDMAGELPYGWQRKLEIARAMCAEPRLLCLDEPAAGLTRVKAKPSMRSCFDLRHEHATSMLLIEHDMRVVMRISDHVIVLDHGVAIADGTPQSVRQDPPSYALILAPRKPKASYLRRAPRDAERAKSALRLRRHRGAAWIRSFYRC